MTVDKRLIAGCCSGRGSYVSDTSACASSDGSHTTSGKYSWDLSGAQIPGEGLSFVMSYDPIVSLLRSHEGMILPWL